MAGLSDRGCGLKSLGCFQPLGLWLSAPRSALTCLAVDVALEPRAGLHASQRLPAALARFSVLTCCLGLPHLAYLEQLAQGGCGCPIPGGIRGQAGCGSGQPALLVGDPAHSRGMKLRDHCAPCQPRPFCDSVILCTHCTRPLPPCLALPCLALPCLALPCLALPCLALQHLPAALAHLAAPT